MRHGARTKIAFAFMLISGLMLSLLGYFGYALMDHSLNDALDNRLTDFGRQAIPDIEFHDDKPVLTGEEDDGAVAAVPPVAAIQLFDAHKQVVQEAGPIRPPLEHEGLNDFSSSSGKFRVLTRHVVGPSKQSAWLQIAIDARGRELAMKSYREMLVIFVPICGLIVCVCGYYFAHMAVDPIEERLARLQHFVADTAHELRTPVTIAQANLEALEGEMPPRDGTESKRLQAVTRSVARMHKLVESLIYLSRVDRRALLQLAPVSIANIVEEVVQEYNEDCARRGLELVASLSYCEVVCDADCIRRAIQNLIENSISYTPAGGVIEVATRTDARRAIIQVKDTGIGIAKEFQGRIFERFFRVEQSRNRHKGGSGLGLSIVKTIVDAHSGRILLSSEEGEGTSFTIELPLPAHFTSASRSPR